MIYYQTWDQAIRAWRFLWEKKPWALVEQFRDAGFPQPGAIATTLIFFLIVCPAFILAGFVTRITSLVFLACCLFILLTGISVSSSLHPQTLALYLGGALTLVFAGPGLLSFDALLTRRRQRRANR